MGAYRLGAASTGPEPTHDRLFGHLGDPLNFATREQEPGDLLLLHEGSVSRYGRP